MNSQPFKIKKVILVAADDKKEEFEDFIRDLEKEFELEFFSEKSSVTDDSLFILIGGDGTLNYLVNNLNATGSPKVLYFAQGTANDFARSLKITPTSPNLHLVKEILNYNLRIKIPRISCNERFFINVATAGNPAQTTESKGGPFKRFFGKVSYYIKGAKKLASQDIYEIELGNPINKSFKTLGFVISQGLFAGGGIKVSSKFIPNFKNELEFLSFASTEVIETSKGILEIQKDSPELSNLPIINEFLHEFKIKSKQKMPVKLDGEEYSSYEFCFKKDALEIEFLLY